MVRTQYPFKFDIPIGPHASQHIGLTGIMPSFYKFLRRANDVAEMHEKDLRLPAKIMDDTRQIMCHQGEVALAKGDPVHRAWNQIEQPLKILNAAHDSANLPNGRERRT